MGFRRPRGAHGVSASAWSGPAFAQPRLTFTNTHPSAHKSSIVSLWGLRVRHVFSAATPLVAFRLAKRRGERHPRALPAWKNLPGRGLGTMHGVCFGSRKRWARNLITHYHTPVRAWPLQIRCILRTRNTDKCRYQVASAVAVLAGAMPLFQRRAKPPDAPGFTKFYLPTPGRR